MRFISSIDHSKRQPKILVLYVRRLYAKNHGRDAVATPIIVKANLSCAGRARSIIGIAREIVQVGVFVAKHDVPDEFELFTRSHTSPDDT